VAKAAAVVVAAAAAAQVAVPERLQVAPPQRVEQRLLLLEVSKVPQPVGAGDVVVAAADAVVFPNRHRGFPMAP